MDTRELREENYVILLIRHDALFLSWSTINFVWIIAVFGGWSSARIKALKEPPVVIPLYSVSDICKLEIEILIWPEYDVPRCSRWDVRWFAAPPAPLSSECLNVSTQNFGFESPTHHIPSSGPESKNKISRDGTLTQSKRPTVHNLHNNITSSRRKK